MPTVAEFDGIKIEFYYDDHPPPHFHARYAEHIVQIDISNLRVLKGSLPRAQLRKVRSWADGRQNLLYLTWIRCAEGITPEQIP